ncbi:glycosyl hydrolase family 17 protein [Sediminicola luteus]|uniref:Endo-1,3-beta-glucanase btgC n=1 Tax=Sediminicola luteus TaxID=319238 RepID=A0A2A4G8R0_9FLAO|nr:glycosyl hydrolase family 17 protein [Sediminicola luteus]PCE64801.1 glycosyl hydrolase family 17 [Sediminicola luteus]
MKHVMNQLCIGALIGVLVCACGTPRKERMQEKTETLTAAEILGNPDYLAISYGGYRMASRSQQPTIEQLIEDMRILHAMGIRVLRTYNVQLPHAAHVLEAIDAIQKTDKDFEMYVMLGAWIDCKNAWTDQPVDHSQESEANAAEIERAIALAKKYPHIVKVLAVGNEAMVKWAERYYVQAEIVLNWVQYIQEQKRQGKLPKTLWVTSSDNFASWGGGDPEYHVPALAQLMHAVDFISMHTYPMHDTHYNPAFWGVDKEDLAKDKKEALEKVMDRAVVYAQQQYQQVKNYMESVGAQKPIHIGETGWASASNGFYGLKGSKATDEYKQALYYKKVRAWTQKQKISCFYFEAFDEPWKDAVNPGGSENHFGLFTVNGQAKYALWSKVDSAVFNGLGRGGKPIGKTFNGQEKMVLDASEIPYASQGIKP